MDTGLSLARGDRDKTHYILSRRSVQGAYYEDAEQQTNTHQPRALRVGTSSVNASGQEGSSRSSTVLQPVSDKQLLLHLQIEYSA